jgi:protein-S-isoprenylcysteine O-methyltransferase Ste14
MKILQRFSTGCIVTAWLVLGCLQLQTAIRERTPLPALIAFESLLVGYRLLSRRVEAANPHSWYVRVGILSSVFVAPLLLRVDTAIPVVGITISAGGVLLTLWALWTLGPAFGIVPADRGLVTGGPYRFIRHPRYAGALLNTLPAVIWNPSPWNLMLLGVILALDMLRIRLEERTVGGYDLYAAQVRWRVIPFVW